MNLRTVLHKLALLLLTAMLSQFAYAQDPTDTLPGDPGAIYVYMYQHLKFGAFVQGASGGTVTVSNSGSRSATGTVVLMNQGGSFFQTIIDVEAVPGSLISITNGPNAILNGSNGGTMELEIGDSDPPSPFNVSIPPPGRTAVNIGGTLTVGNSGTSPPGTYTGVFYITFNYE